jgi:hypothetical protein
MVNNDDAGETYLDVVKGEVRARRGRRVRSRGPYSASEAKARRAWALFLAAMHHMHGELADVTADDMTVFLTNGRLVMERYSWRNTGDDIEGISPHVVMDELGMDVPEESGDQDIYDELQLSCAQSCARRIARNQCKAGAGTRPGIHMKIGQQNGPHHTDWGPDC